MKQNAGDIAAARQFAHMALWTIARVRGAIAHRVYKSDHPVDTALAERLATAGRDANAAYHELNAICWELGLTDVPKHAMSKRLPKGNHDA